MNEYCDLLITNAKIASMQNNGEMYGLYENASLAIKDAKIIYIGHSSECAYTSERTINAEGKLITPGLIDCHTHLIYGGNRAIEFEQRLTGLSYEEIARKGGGIQSTVNHTRNATEDELFSSAIKRAKRLLEEGVCTVEIKSGYGLDEETEIKMLKVAKRIQQALPIQVESTYLGAHTVPKEYKDDPEAYVDFVCQHMIPMVAKEELASCVDVFCESIGFSPSQCERIYKSALHHNLQIKAHVEQLSDLSGAALAASYGALSVDHLEYLSNKDIDTLKSSGCVAVLLPGAFYFLKETKLPPVQALRDKNIPIAIATDLNPGSSALASLLTTMNMSCVLFGLTPEEALLGVTVNAAKALKLNDKGSLAVGKDADFCLWDAKHPSELAYGINLMRPEQVFIGGESVDT